MPPRRFPSPKNPGDGVNIRHWLAIVLLLLVPLVGSAQPLWITFPGLRNWLPARDPMPVRRVFLSPQQYAEFMVTPGQAPFVRMTQAEFESRMRAAAVVMQAPRPYLTESRYSAKFVNGALAGNAEWKVKLPRHPAGVLSLDPLRIAVSDLRWEDGRPANIWRTATASADDRSKTVVSVEADAEAGSKSDSKSLTRTLKGQWSARSASDTEPNHFLLRFPTATVTHLDLDLPAKLTPIIRRDRAILTGPHATETADFKRWTFSLGGQDTCEFTLRDGTDPSVAQPGSAKAIQRWTINEGGYEGKVSFEFEAGHPRADEYQFELAAGLQVVDIVADVPVSWKVEARTLRIAPVDPGALPRITMTVRMAASPFGQAWTIPTITLAGRLPSDDAIQLKLASGLRISAFKPGDYQIVESDTTDDGGRMVKLAGTFSNGQSVTRLSPTLTFDVVPAQITVAERATMNLHRQDLRIRILATLTATHGPVSEASFIVPRGFQLTDLPVVETDPAAVITSKPRQSVEVSMRFGRPLSTGQSTAVSFQLIQTLEAKRGDVHFAVPAVMWNRAERTGSVTVNPSNAFEPSSPFVVVYQDFPPEGEQVLKLAEARTSPDQTATDPSIPSRGAAGKGTASEAPVRPERCLARVEPRRVCLDLTGHTAANAAIQRLTIPQGMQVESVRVSQQWLEGFRVVNGVLEYESGTIGNEPFEIHGCIPHSSRLIESLRLDIDDGGECAVQWNATTGILLGVSQSSRSVWMVQPALLVGIGWLFSALLIPSLIRTGWGVPSRGAFWLFLAVASLTGACMFVSGLEFAALLPASLALIGLVIGVCRKQPYPIIASDSQAAKPLSKSALVAILVAVMSLGFPASAAAPTIPTVYFVYGTGDDAKTLFALVPKEVNDRLEKLMNLQPADSVFTHAEYRVDEGQDRANEAAFDAKWTVLLTGNAPLTLAVPCTGAKVTSVLLDGQTAFPVPLPNGFSLTLSGPGLHVLTAKMTVPIRSIADERELRFSGPDVPSATLDFQSAISSRSVSVASRKGRQSTVRTGNAGSEIHAELGEGNTVLLRWRTVEPSAVTPAEPSKEVAVWDLAEGTSVLNAGFLFSTSLSPPVYRIVIPPGLVVTRVSARSIDRGTPIPTDWNEENTGEVKDATNPAKPRIIAVTARSAGDGGVAISLTAVPGRTLSSQPVLSFPRAATRPDPQAIYAIRTNGITLTKFTVTGAIDWPAESAAKAALRFPEWNLDSRPATKAIQRTDDALSLKLSLAPSESHTLAQHKFVWTLSRRSDLRVESKWDAPSPIFETWELPESLTPVTVRGTDVIDWSFVNRQLGVWLRTDDDGAIVRWTATAGEQSETVRTLPLPRSAKSNPAPSLVQLRSTPGWSVKLLSTTGVKAMADQSNLYSVDASVDAIRVSVEPAAIASSANPAPAPPPAPADTTSPSSASSKSTPQVDPVSTPALESRDVTNGTGPVTPIWRSMAAWLASLAVMAGLTRGSRHRFVPELVMGWGVLAWVALGPLFAAIVVTGFIHRLLLMLK
ncbi:MAG: hypothetical protein U0798_18890 [Gemmataceae bacterium]